MLLSEGSLFLFFSFKIGKLRFQVDVECWWNWVEVQFLMIFFGWVLSGFYVVEEVECWGYWFKVICYSVSGCLLFLGVFKFFKGFVCGCWVSWLLGFREVRRQGLGCEDKYVIYFEDCVVFFGCFVCCVICLSVWLCFFC